MQEIIFEPQELYSNTPVDASLFGLYLHQNYSAYCDTVEQCEAFVDGLSWVDANGGDNVRALCLYL